MMKTVFTFLSLMLIASLGFAQNGPITFEPGEEGADWTWEVFENDTNPDLQIIPNPDTMGANTSATVAQFTALQTGAPFAGCQSEQTVDLGTFEWDSTNRTVKIMVWKSEISDVGIKFDTETGWSEGEIKVSNTVVNEWEELTFDFSNAQNPPPGNGQLSRIVIFPDFNNEGRSQDNVVYFDNVRFEEASAEPDEVVVEVDAAATFTGFANVFETPANGGGFAFGSPWGVADIKSVIDTAGNSVTLFPNFNTYADNPDDPFWVDQTTGLGNKVFEGNTFVEDASLAGKTVTFEGQVESYTLSPDYETRVYIKVFNSDFSELKEVSEPLTEAGSFSITFDNPEAADAVVQYGFSVTGINANPADEAALGNVVIVAGDGGTGPEEEVVGVDANANFLGFANVFETPANGGGFVFGSPWGVPDIKSVIDSTENTVTLFPNFNTYGDNPDDPFWVDQMTGLGNKTFEGNTFVEDTLLAGKTVTFEGEVASYTLSTDYLTKVYIKVFNSDFSVLKEVTDTLTEAGPFSITFDNPEAADAVVQYGFSVTGLNANPDDEAALGNVVILGEGGGPVTDPQVAAPDPTEAEENVLSLFSDMYTDVEVDTWLEPGSLGDLEDIEINGNPTKKYTNLNVIAVEATNDNVIDASEMDFFHIDLWTPNIDTLTITIVDWGPDGELLGGDDSSEELVFTDLVQGQWNSLQLPMEDFEGLTARSNLAQFIFFGLPRGEGTLFVDNVYFSKMPTSVAIPEAIDAKVYPNPTSEFVILETKTPVTSFTMYALNGQRVLEMENPGSKVNVSSHSAGLYIIEVETQKGVMRQRLIIQ